MVKIISLHRHKKNLSTQTNIVNSYNRKNLILMFTNLNILKSFVALSLKYLLNLSDEDFCYINKF